VGAGHQPFDEKVNEILMEGSDLEIAIPRLSETQGLIVNINNINS
jgi:hypothetical protein